ncbi:reverse transcriptase domain-containing protein [Tanacetum coccineum]
MDFLISYQEKKVPIDGCHLIFKGCRLWMKTSILTENFMYYQVFRGDGSFKNYKVLSEMLEDFDRQDVKELYRLVKESTQVSSMSDSEDSTVTYTEISSPYEDLSDVGSPGAEGPIFQDPPSPDYVPGPEEPEQAPPSPIYIPFVPEPVYPEFLPVDDEVFPAEEQPMPAADSPTHQSPGYIPESDPEEDPEEDDEEDPEEDPADYPADRGDDRDDEEPSDDDDDDEDEEHLAPADPAVVAYSSDQDPYLAYRVTARMSIRPHAPAPLSSEPVHIVEDLWDNEAGIRQRDALPSLVHETEMPEICLPLRKRPCRTTPGPRYEVGKSSTAGAARQEDEIIYSQLDDARYDRALLRARVNMLYRDRPFHRRTAILMEEEARLSRAAWAQSMDACNQTRSEGISLRTTVMAQQSEITELQEADVVKSLKTQMIELQRQQGPAKDPAEPELPEEARLIEKGVTAVLAARATTRNGDDSHTSGTGVRRNERAVRECTYQDFMKCQPLFFRGTEGVVDLTQWNSVNDVAYAMTWSDLKKKMTTKYCPRNEIKKIEAELWNLKVKGTDVVAYNQRFQELALLCDRMFPEETDKIERYVGGMPDLIYSSVVHRCPKTMQEAIEMATELMDRRNNTFAERQAENKRKFEDTPRNNQTTPNKKAEHRQGLCCRER